MARPLLAVFFLMAAAFSLRGQCTYSCSSYSVSAIQFSMLPADGHTLSMMDDEVTTTLPLNFNFDFYCTTYNQVRICSNGFITFDFSNIQWGGTPYAQSLPSATVPNAVIAWNWNDLDPSMGGTITYTTIGTSPNQKFVVTYSDVPLWTPTSPPSTLINTGQIILHESTHLIEVHVAKARNNGWLTHTEGIEDASATLGVTVPGRNLSLWTADQSSHLFSPYETGQPPAVVGSTLLCEGSPGTFFTSTLTNAQGYHWTFPPGWSTGGGTQPSITATPGSSGNVSVAAIYTCGNSPEAVFQVNVIHAPVISVISATPATFCSNKIFTVVPAGASSYTLLPDNLVSSSTFTTRPASTTIYSITGSAQGCNALTTATVQATVKPSPTLAVTSGTICIGNSFLIQPSGANSYTFSSLFPFVSPQTPGLYTYSVTGTGFNGCVSAPAISTVSVAPLPTLVISQDRPRICAKETVTLTAVNAITYTWTISGGYTSTVAVTPFASTTYQVYGTDHLGCIGSGSLHVVVQNCVGIGELQEGGIRIFPNPSSGKVQLDVPRSMELEIRDVLGRLLMNTTIRAGVSVLDVGVYGQDVLLVTLTSGSGRITRRLVVQSTD